MYSRISAWPAVGLISKLQSSLESKNVSAAIGQFPWDTLSDRRGDADRTLAVEIIGVQKRLASIMKNNPYDFHDTTQLLAAVKTAVEEKANYRFYNRHTALEFHYFVTATFTGFARALAIVNEFHNDSDSVSPV